MMGVLSLLGATAQAEVTASEVERAVVKSVPSQLTGAALMAGATETGATVGVRGVFRTKQDVPVVILDIEAGNPILRVSGQAEGIPVQIKRVETSAGNFDLQVLPVKGQVMLSLPQVKDPHRVHYLINPNLVMKYSMGDTAGFSGKARLRVGPALGAVGDGDGDMGVAALNLGADLEVQFALHDDLKSYARLSLDYFNSVSSQLKTGSTGCFEAGVERNYLYGLGWGAGLQVKRTQFDVLGASGHQDDGVSEFVGGFVNLKF